METARHVFCGPDTDILGDACDFDELVFLLPTKYAITGIRMRGTAAAKTAAIWTTIYRNTYFIFRTFAPPPPPAECI